ncbi:MAG: site-specific tyrosine recombinase XerC [Deltaproteobacteria bacterium]|nr:site-specific tyrosine recombinase XerC [Deltaproteobacteria bacterium]
MRNPRKPFGDTSDPSGFPARVLAFLDWLRAHNYSEQTARTWGRQLRTFIEWCAQRELTRPSDVTRPLLERFQRHLHQYRKGNGEPLAPSSQNGCLIAIKRFFHWLAKNQHVQFNPASELELLRIGLQLPKSILTAQEAEKILALPDVNDALGVRDRAILETFYSTGMRRMELAGWKLSDLDRSRGVVTIRKGKNKKDRVVPIGTRAVQWVDKYLSEVRPELVRDAGEQRIFLSRQGGGIGLGALSSLVGKYVVAADLGKEGACHIFRHTMATLMLENGADLRVIQEILGHACLTTTQIYTHLSIGRLKEIHTAPHPTARPGGATDEAPEPAPEIPR